MNTEKYLRQIVRFEVMINNKMAEERRIRDAATKITPVTDREPVQNFRISDPVGLRGTELVAIADKIEQLQEDRNRIIDQIDNMDNEMHYMVLTYRYVQDMRVFDVADKIDLSLRQTQKILKEAKEEFERKYGELYLNSEQ